MTDVARVVVAVNELWVDTVPGVDEVLDCDNKTVLELPTELPKMLGFTLAAVCDVVDIDDVFVLGPNPVVELDADLGV